MASRFLLLIAFIVVLVSQIEGQLSENGIQSACNLAHDPKFCHSSLIVAPEALQAGPKDLSEIALKMSIAKAKIVQAFIPRQSGSSTGRPSGPSMGSKQSQAIEDCWILYDLTLDYLTKSLSKLSNSSVDSVKFKDAVDIQSYLSAALTNQVTCLEGLSEDNSNVHGLNFANYINNVSLSVSNNLALTKKFWIAGKGSQKNSVNNRRLLADGDDFQKQYGSVDDGFPSWLSRADRRRLLQTTNDAILAGSVVTVALDGSGNYTTITDAISGAPNNSADRYVIYVTRGVYEEYVQIPKYKTNIMLLGDGMDVTVITGNKSVVDGWTTFNSATLSAVGQGFLMRDITIENTAGAVKQQAVAMRVGSDLSAFYRCSFKGYQDTLYTHSLRQFYRECDIYGTVDYIFGNAAVVFQNCNLLARRPLDGQQNTYTAQGRTDPNQNTGTSVQNCNVSAASDLAPVISSFPTYLGRPWKTYSRTVFMQCYLDSVIQPAGWLEWSGNFALSTLYYGEYQNQGPGAGIAQRVTWPGFIAAMNTSDAQNLTVSSFIAGDSWLASAAVPFDGGLALI